MVVLAPILVGMLVLVAVVSGGSVILAIGSSCGGGNGGV